MNSEIMVALQHKADKSDIQELIQLKSNKTDMELSWNFLETLHKQMKHLSVIVKEFLKTTVNTQPQTEHERLGKLSYLATQSESVVQWVNKFNIQESTQYFKNEHKKSNRGSILLGEMREKSPSSIPRLPFDGDFKGFSRAKFLSETH